MTDSGHIGRDLLLLLTFLHAAHVTQLGSLVLAVFAAAGALFQIVLGANGPGTHLIQNASGATKTIQFQYIFQM